MKRPRLRAYLGLGLLAAGLCGLALSGDLLLHAGRLWAFYGLSLAGFGLLATAATSLPLRGALVAGILLRVVFLPVTPSLSDDVYRYLWDGQVQRAGVSPYLYAPADPRLDRVAGSETGAAGGGGSGEADAGRSGQADRGEEAGGSAPDTAGLRALVNHPRLRTVYPPLAQALFLGVAGASDAAGLDPARGGVLLWKLVAGAADLLTAAAVWWLADAKRRRQATVLYLLCPAVILQTWEAAHLEMVAVGLAVVAAALLVRGRDWQAGVALGLAAGFKLTPAALLLPALLGGRASPGRLLAGFVPAFVLPLLPYVLGSGRLHGVFGGVAAAGTGWTGSALLFSLLTYLLPARAAQAVCLVVFLAGAVGIARRMRGRAQTARSFAWTLTLLVLCLPVVHAWYWLAPLTFGLVAGVWLPVVLGLIAPIPEATATRWPGGRAAAILGRR